MAQKNGRSKRISWWRVIWKILAVTVRALIGFSVLGIVACLMLIFTSRVLCRMIFSFIAMLNILFIILHCSMLYNHE